MAIASLDVYKLGFVGAGNMAESIARGVVKSGVLSPSAIRTSHHRADRRLVFQSFGVEILESSGQVVADSDIIILSVKPQVGCLLLPDSFMASLVNAWNQKVKSYC